MKKEKNMIRGTRVEINLDLLKKNYCELKNHMDEDVKIAGVVKANAYGHDLHTISEELTALGVDYLMVANLREALSIKNYFDLKSIKASTSIMVMGATNQIDFESALKANIILTIFSLEDALLLNSIALKLEIQARIHIKIDTGFNRLGYKDYEFAADELQKMFECKGLCVEGVFTHLALKNNKTDEDQFEKFDAFTRMLEGRSIDIPIKHACDSIGTIAHDEKRYDLVRMGSLLYGYCSRPTPFTLSPIMTFKTNVTAVKWIEVGEGVSYDYTYIATQRTKIATLPVGYADGLPRALSNKGYVLINGIKAPIVGLMCMDQCMVDVTHISGCEVGAEVILFDSDKLPLSVISDFAKTNKNEILSGISMRVPRVFYKNGTVHKIVDYLLS